MPQKEPLSPPLLAVAGIVAALGTLIAITVPDLNFIYLGGILIGAMWAVVGILSAIAAHHSGPGGFLTEGVDWNNHNSQRHHINYDYYGDVRYTEPLLAYYREHPEFVFPSTRFNEVISFVEQGLKDLSISRTSIFARSKSV